MNTTENIGKGLLNTLGYSNTHSMSLQDKLTRMLTQNLGRLRLIRILNNIHYDLSYQILS